MEELEGFNKTEHPLYGISVVEWEGFLYINLSPEPEPFEQKHAPLMGKFAPWQLPRLRIGGKVEYDIKANWKLLIQNYSECYHCPGVHPALSKLSPYRSGDNDLKEGPFLGGSMLINHEAGSMTISGRACASPIGDVSGDALNKVYYYSLFPNVLLSFHPDYVMLHTLWPQSAGRTLVTCEWLFEPEAMAIPGFDAQDAIDFWDMTNKQDWNMCELSQLGISSRAYRPGPYSTLERVPVAFDRYYLSRIMS
jgi:Rieske 2Fe-2S family protein